MKRNMQREAGTMVLVAAGMAGALVGMGCNAAGELEETCATATFEDVSNLDFGVIGTVVDDLGMPVAGAKVFVGNTFETYADANGRFAIASVDLGGLSTVILSGEAEGYPDKVQEIEVPSDHLADIQLVMKPFTSTDVIDIQEGGTVSDGTAFVTFEADSLMYEDTGEPVVGPVEISVVSYRPDSMDDMKAAPGSLYGSNPLDAAGEPLLDGDGNPTFSIEPILTFGMVDVSMWQNGLRLELIPGKPAYVVLQDIVEGEHYPEKIQAFNDENSDVLDTFVEPSIPLWHFNYESAYWDRVVGYDWLFEEGSEGGYLTISSLVPEFSPANPDRPQIVCTSSIDVVNPLETCVCKNVMHKNDVDPVRGAAMSLMSRARSYTYLVRSCSDGSSTRTLVNSSLVTWLSRATTDQLGNFCGSAIVDPLSNVGEVLMESTKTYWPGRLDEEDRQFKDTEGDGNFDDNGDGLVDPENIVGFLGDTYIDQWRKPLSGVLSCGAPDEVIHVECINEPSDPATGEQPE